MGAVHLGADLSFDDGCGHRASRARCAEHCSEACKAQGRGMSDSPWPWPLHRRALKRTLDLAVSSVMLGVLALPMCLIALAIRATSKGPALFRQERVGRGGRPFKILKFRTMIEDAAKLGPLLTAANDPRRTPLGRVLRRIKFDELPQFINVLVGDMSLVGPRPEVAEYVERYTSENRAILSVRPGITDPASIAYR